MSFTCAVCQNTNFYEDAEGQLSCAVCGIQSQDFLAVSNDLDENVADNRNEKRKWQSRKSISSEAVKPLLKRDNLSTKEYIEVYQYCLKLLVSCVPNGSDRLKDQVKHLWGAYLNKWMESEDNRELMGHSTSSSSYVKESGRETKRRVTAPPVDSMRYDNVYKCVPPYKPLLLAFLYLAIRQMRLPILPSDLVRWCLHGQLPYSSLFEKLPADVQARIPAVYRKRLVEHFNPRVSTTSNIMYNTSVLASFLDVPIAPLNAPLTVRTIINALGLPASVWHNYARLAQILRHESELQVFDSENELYVENLMAQVIVCVLLCPGWDSWSFQRCSSSRGGENADTDTTAVDIEDGNKPFSMPTTLPSLATVSRNELPRLLSTIRATLYSFHRHLPHVPEAVLTFNQPTQTLLRDVSPSVLLNVFSHHEDGFNSQGVQFWSSNTVAVSRVQVPTVVLDPARTLLSNNSSMSEAIDTNAPRLSSLPCYSNHVNDSGVLLPAYTALLERCAVYLHSTPAILFRLVLSYETPIAELAQLLADKAAASEMAEGAVAAKEPDL